MARPPETRLSFSNIVRQSAPVFFNGRRVGEHQVMRTDARNEIDVRTIGGNELITVAIHVPLFEAVARATLGARFFDDKSSDCFSLHDAQRRPELNRSLIALLAEGFTRSDRLSNPDYGRNWEYRVLDEWLSGVIAPDAARLQLRAIMLPVVPRRS